MAGGRGSATGRFSSWPCLHARRSLSTNVSSRVGAVTDAKQAQLGVPVALLVEPPVAADLLELEPLHGNCVVRATLHAQCAADTAFFVEHHRGAVGPAVRVHQLGEWPLRLHLVDV